MSHEIRVLSLFSGFGGIDLGLKAAGGFRTVCYVEINPYAQEVLKARQIDGGLDLGPIWDNVSTFDGNPWRGRADLVAGGFPCQDISLAGKQAGIDGEKSGLWREMHRIIREVRPRYVLVENVAALIDRGLGRVLGDLAAIGYDAEWSVVSACSVGAPHMRERLFILAYPDGLGPQAAEDEPREARGVLVSQGTSDGAGVQMGRYPWHEGPDGLVGMAYGVPHRVERTEGLGNAVVPQVAEWIGRRIMKATSADRG